MRHAITLGGLLGLLLAYGLMVAIAGSTQAGGPVYALAELRERLAAHPAEWAGRTVGVRAIAMPCPWLGQVEQARHCAGRPPVLAAAHPDPPGDPLPLDRSASRPLWSILRQLPNLGDLPPRPRMVPLFASARFRVRLLALPTSTGAVCYEALLLDAAPGAP